MTPAAQLLVDAFGRIKGVVHRAVDGLAKEQLTFRADPDANTIAWLVWHLTRIQDDHVADVAGTGQIWIDEGWADRFGLPFPHSATGFGHASSDVAAVQTDGELLIAYHDAVYARTVSYVSDLGDEEYARIVDRSWDPPVTLGVRLVSVISDDLQHAGQAAVIRGLVERAGQ